MPWPPATGRTHRQLRLSSHDPRRAPCPQLFEFVLHGPHALAITARAGSPRPDVAKALHSPHAVNAGFDILAALPAAVKRGRYGVMIALTHDGSIETCATGRFLSIE